MKRKRGFTLTELFVVVVIGVCIGGIFFSVFGRPNGSVQEEMVRYCQKAYPGKTVVGISCMNIDSDANGYVSCSATILNPDGSIFTRESAECASGFIGSGCRIR